MSKNKYDVWVSEFGKKKTPVKDLTDLHLLHIIRGFVDGRFKFQPTMFPVNMMSDEADLPDEAAEICLEENDKECKKETENWLIVLKAEAIRRGLDWEKAPSRRMGLFDWIMEKLKGRPDAKDAQLYVNKMRWILRQDSVTEPELDVSNLDGRVSYMHWNTEKGVPIDRTTDNDIPF